MSNALAIQGPDPFSAYADAVAPRGIVGKLLKFTRGDYLAGEDSEEIKAGTVMAAGVPELMVGWVLWRDNKPTEHRMVRLIEGIRPASRDSLGDTDQSKWEVDANTGKPRDPWQFVNYLPLLDSNGELYTFTVSSRGGLNAIGDLCRRYAQHRRANPDMLPVIKLEVDSYEHKVKAYGRIKVPKLAAAGWAKKADFDAALSAAGIIASPDVAAQPLAALKDEMSDEIPF